VCFYDTYEFKGEPIGIPSHFDLDSNKFTCWGCFCSLECAKAHIYESNDLRKDNKFSLLATMSRKMYGKHTRINRAPSKYTLQKFGGPLSIEDFRSEMSRTQLWILNNPKVTKTFLVYDVYFNNDSFEVMHKAVDKKKKNESEFTLKRSKGAFRIPKSSLNAFLGKVQMDD
tara:strand:+ start:891 stop:1403 length:513 start_codon:yes stop_codon:yes gene_type:complete